MTPVADQLTQMAMLLFCLIFAPAGQKETTMTIVGKDGRALDIKAVRIETGFELRATGKDGQEGPFAAVVCQRENPYDMEFKPTSGKSERIDLAGVAKEVLAAKDKPQTVKFRNSDVKIEPKGGDFAVTFAAKRTTITVHPGGTAASQPATGRATSQPAGQAPTGGATPAIAAGVDAAKKFWAAVVSGDTATMKGFYAEKVMLKAGSEMLKPEYALDEKADRAKDLTVDREKLIALYSRLIGQAGTRWTDALARFQPDFAAAAQGGKPFEPVRLGDLVLMARESNGRNDKLVFIFRQDDGGRWSIIAERTDY